MQRAWILAVALTLTSACIESPVGAFAALSTRPISASFTELSAAASGEACVWQVLGVLFESATPALLRATRAALYPHPPADALADVSVRFERFTTGIVNRTCVYVQGRAVRVGS